MQPGVGAHCSCVTPRLRHPQGGLLSAFCRELFYLIVAHARMYHFFFRRMECHSTGSAGDFLVLGVP